MVNQALRMKIAYRSKKKKREKENTRDRSVPDGSDIKLLDSVSENSHYLILGSGTSGGRNESFGL